MTERSKPSRWRRAGRPDVVGPPEVRFAEDETPPRENPYVGARPFEASESALFFGRAREQRKLAALIVARRTVLLYAESGAGKTSLVQAGLVPHLQETRGTEVLPLGRVGGDLPPGVEGARVGNIYVFNTLLNMLGEKARPRQLLDLSLSQGLETHFGLKRGAEQPVLLVLDQFEELFTSHLDRYPERACFFDQLRACLNDYAHLSLLLALREDYLAQFDAYAGLMPDRLRARFRMERLGYSAALSAVEEPARRAGLSFEAGVAEALVANLAGLRVQGRGEREKGTADDDTALLPQEPDAEGVYVEPVHLQIVCSQLWDKVPADQKQIRAEDVERFGDVDQALAGLYQEVLDEVMEKTDVGERQLRAWFAAPLITPVGTRGLVYRDEGKEETQGLPNQAVNLLYDAYLIRPVKRGDDTWYELAHDRLVAPIVKANRAWELEQAKQLPLQLEAFEVDRPAIMQGGEVTLTWRAEGADELTLYPQFLKIPLSGSIPLRPAETTIYYLSAVKSGIREVTSQPQEVVVMELDPGRWALLLGEISAGRATPIIGNALCDGRILEGRQTLIQAWAEKVGYAPGERADLAQVAQFIHVTSRDPRAVQDSYVRFLKGRLERMALKDEADDPFSILARLPASVYLTTSPLKLVEDALRLAGKESVTGFCRWHDGLDDIPSMLQEETDFVPSIHRPLVYHFYGLVEYPGSMVLTEDDHWGFMARVREDRDIVPIEVRQAMYRRYPLLLGYDWQSWEFKALLHGLLSRNTTRRPRGTFQADSSGEKAEEIRFMVSYLSKYRLDIYWDDSRSFLRGLWRDWSMDR